MSAASKHRVNTLDGARNVLTAVCHEQPTRCNPTVHGSTGGDIISQMLIYSNLPVVPTLMRDQPFLQYWETLAREHRHRMAIPEDVAKWLDRVERVFESPADYDYPSRSYVSWKEGLRRCKSAFLL